MGKNRHPAGFLRILAAALALSACAGSQPGHEDSSATSASAARPTGATTASASTAAVPATTAAPSTAAPPNTEEGLTAAVDDFWALYLELGARTGPFDPTATRARLEGRTTGRELRRLFDFFQTNARAGYVLRGTISNAPTVISVEDTSARVRDCYDDATGLYRASDGTRLDADDPRRHQVLMSFVREGGVWKVSAITHEGDGCDA